jgi:hypothetical protein
LTIIAVLSASLGWKSSMEPLGSVSDAGKVTVVPMPGLPMLAQAYRAPLALWMTIERPTIHMLPLEPAAEE